MDRDMDRDMDPAKAPRRERSDRARSGEAQGCAAAAMPASSCASPGPITAPVDRTLAAMTAPESTPHRGKARPPRQGASIDRDAAPPTGPRDKPTMAISQRERI
jgi:hypothetical protein